MSFFGNNNNNTSTGFGSGGFGASTNTNTGFGANNASTSGSIFGSNTATSGGFGSGGGFGSTNNSPFGAKPSGFGTTATTTGGSLFGGGNTSTGGTGFGSTGFGSTNNTTTGFGSNTGGGLFGANKPATTGFGSTNTGGSIFGGGNTNTGFGSNTGTANTGFGSTNTNTGFGASTNNASTGFGGFGSTAQSTNGTAGTPFTPLTERDGAANQTIAYQSITTLAPYKAKSFEELRLEDYLQGRRYGNNNGQAGGFGTSTGFGGGSSVFGATNNNATNTSGGLFGNNNNSTANTGTGFGGFGSTNNATTNTNTGFGSTGGGLFGQNKPAGGGLFGQSTTAPAAGAFGSTAGSTGGLFGSGGGFGANNNNNNAAATNTGGGLFGNTANKPAFGGFGSTNNTTTGFGATNTNTTGGGLFGNNNTTTNTGGGLFGNNNNNTQPAASGFGASTTGGGLFGNNQNKPAGGLFGNAAPATGSTGGGLFGNNNAAQPAQASGGLFGSTNTNTGGGLFGNNANQNKPGGLFGASTTTTTGGSLFGNNTQPAGGSLFGNNNSNTGSSLFGNTANKPATGGLFGGAANTGSTGGGLFGNNTTNQGATGGSLFGGSVAQPAQNQAAGSSLFGGSLAQSQTPQQNQLHASLSVAPYGNEQLFGSLAASATPIGPLATPLTGAKPAQSKTPSLLSSTRLNSPVYTPRGSFSRGGTYSYATPSSSFSTSLTPGASSLLKPTGSIGSNLSSRLAKSISMQNLRGDTSTPREGESLLRPIPGSASSRFLATGSMRKLNIDRSLRIDLFSPPPEQKQHEAAKENDASLRKKVSFDNSAEKETPEPSAANALVRTEDKEEDRTPTLFRAAPKPRPQSSGGPEMTQINGSSSLAPVQEGVQSGRPNGVATRSSSKAATGSTANSEQAVEIGEYWSNPSIKELKEMSRGQLSKLPKFVVGRSGTGRIEFSSCDLSDTELDNILGNIVKLEYRSATVYPNTMEKPARGKGLNVPSTIFLENVLPKNPTNRKAIQAGKQPNLDRFLQSLRTIANTTLKSFDEKTGLWCFTVEHFTTYGFDEDDETEVTDTNLREESSMLSDPPATPGAQDETMHSTASAGVEDTFQFKIQQRSISSGPHVPGGFDSNQGYEFDFADPDAVDDMMYEEEGDQTTGALSDDPFTDHQMGGAVQAPSPGAYQRYEESMLIESGAADLEDVLEDLPGSFIDAEPLGLRSILKPTAAPYSAAYPTSPEKLVAESWEDQLLRTISPKKRDRQQLREVQAGLLIDDRPIESPFKQSMLGQSHLALKGAKKSVGFNDNILTAADNVRLGQSQAFRNSMDLMNSLWAADKPTTRRTAAAAKGFEV